MSEMCIESHLAGGIVAFAIFGAMFVFAIIMYTLNKWREESNTQNQNKENEVSEK